VTKESLDSQGLSQQPRRAPPIARALRILLGLALIVYMVPIYSRVPVRLAVGALLLMLGLIGVYSLIHILVSRRIIAFGPRLGIIVTKSAELACLIFSPLDRLERKLRRKRDANSESIRPPWRAS
jgi:hypothetical protein